MSKHTGEGTHYDKHIKGKNNIMKEHNGKPAFQRREHCAETFGLPHTGA